MFAHKRLGAWKAAHALALEVYRVSQAWPASERYGLTAQVRRAATSVPLNIAEGAARRGPRQFRQFLDYAIGSQGELNYALEIALELGYVTAEEHVLLSELAAKAGKLVWGLYRKMQVE